MLNIIYSLKELNFYQLMHVYEESNFENGSQNYPGLSSNQQVMQAEQDFYEYLRLFFKCPEAFYAIWEIDGKYISALRIEPFQDGVLLEALETTPEHRRRGYAGSLVREVLKHLTAQKALPVYSHVRKHNKASLQVHLTCGFKIILEHAVYVDGSVMHNSYTLKYHFTHT